MKIDNTYTFEISSDDVTVLGAHPKSGLPTISIQGSCTSPDGDTYEFVATNNLDMRYADRFKVNWNGNKARMPEVAGHGLEDDVKAGRRITASLIIPRGPRISIARKCAQLFPQSRQTSLVSSSAAEVAEEVEAAGRRLGPWQAAVPEDVERLRDPVLARRAQHVITEIARVRRHSESARAHRAAADALFGAKD